LKGRKARMDFVSSPYWLNGALLPNRWARFKQCRPDIGGQIDVVQFDTKLGEVQTLLKASENIKVKGRGGTCFQPFIDFVAKHPEYDGALIYTDGYASKPTIPATMRTPLCWALRSEKEFKEHEDRMRQSGRVCVIENT